MKIKRIIALGIAGCLLFSSTAIAAPAAEAVKDPAAIEAPAKLEATITEEKISSVNDLIEIDIAYPVISGLTDAAGEKELNESIKNQITKMKNDMEADVKEYEKLAAENDFPIRQYQLFVDYDVMTNNADFLSFTMTYYTYTGGANGMTAVQAYNIDKKANKPVKLEDLFPLGANYVEVINKEIVKQIEVRSQNDEEMFFEGEMGFKTISPTHNFYLKDGNLVIIFEKYDIAPGAMGIPEFALDLADLKAKITVNNDSKVVVDMKISKINGIDVIPLREVVEDLGYKVDWNANDRSILVTKGTATAKLKIGDTIYIANHKIPYDLGFAPVIVDGSTYVPLSFLEEVLLYKF